MTDKTAPFDLELAKAGHALITRGGDKVVFEKHDSGGPEHSRIRCRIFGRNGVVNVVYYYESGRHIPNITTAVDLLLLKSEDEKPAEHPKYLPFQLDQAEMGAPLVNRRGQFGYLDSTHHNSEREKRLTALFQVKNDAWSKGFYHEVRFLHEDGRAISNRPWLDAFMVDVDGLMKSGSGKFDLDAARRGELMMTSTGHVAQYGRPSYSSQPGDFVCQVYYKGGPKACYCTNDGRVHQMVMDRHQDEGMTPVLIPMFNQQLFMLCHASTKDKNVETPNEPMAPTPKRLTRRPFDSSEAANPTLLITRDGRVAHTKDYLFNSTYPHNCLIWDEQGCAKSPRATWVTETGGYWANDDNPKQKMHPLDMFMLNSDRPAWHVPSIGEYRGFDLQSARNGELVVIGSTGQIMKFVEHVADAEPFSRVIVMGLADKKIRSFSNAGVSEDLDQAGVPYELKMYRLPSHVPMAASVRVYRPWTKEEALAQSNDWFYYVGTKDKPKYVVSRVTEVEILDGTTRFKFGALSIEQG